MGHFRGRRKGKRIPSDFKAGMDYGKISWTKASYYSYFIFAYSLSLALHFLQTAV